MGAPGLIRRLNVKAEQFSEHVLPTTGELFNEITLANRIHVIPKKLVKDRRSVIFKEADHLATNLWRL